jgi:hypothetical protein
MKDLEEAAKIAHFRRCSVFRERMKARGAKENQSQGVERKRKAEKVEPVPVKTPVVIDLDDLPERSDELLDQSRQSSQPVAFAALEEVSRRRDGRGSAQAPPASSSVFVDPFAHQDAAIDAVAAWSYVEDEVLPEEEQLALAQAMSLSVESEARLAADAALSASSDACLVRGRVSAALEDDVHSRSAHAPAVEPADDEGYQPGQLWAAAARRPAPTAPSYLQRVPMLDALSEWEAARDSIILDWNGDPSDRSAILERLGEAALRRDAQLERDATRRRAWSRLLGLALPDDSTSDTRKQKEEEEEEEEEEDAAASPDPSCDLPVERRMELLDWCRSTKEGQRVWRSAHTGAAAFGVATVSVSETLLLVGASGIEVTADELMTFMRAYSIPHKPR